MADLVLIVKTVLSLSHDKNPLNSVAMAMVV